MHRLPVRHQDAAGHLREDQLPRAGLSQGEADEAEQGRLLQGMHGCQMAIAEYLNCTEFPIPSCREVFRIILREFPCTARAVASCSIGLQVEGAQ